MGLFFNLGEKKVRPGQYQRYENSGGAVIAGATDGVCATVFQGSWGPCGQVLTFDSMDTVRKMLGAKCAEDGTVRDMEELFQGGATTVLAVRLGRGGTAGSLVLSDAAADNPAEAVQLTLIYPGARRISASLRESLTDDGMRELVLYENGMELKKYPFAAGEGEADRLVEAVNADKTLVRAAKQAGYTGNGILAKVVQKAFAAGENPQVTTESYSDAFAALEAYRWNTISVDTNDTAVHLLLAAYMDRVYANGKFAFCVIGEPSSVALEERMRHAAAFNDYKTVYVGGGWKNADGTLVEGHPAAARIAGMTASCPSSRGLTHAQISGAVEPTERLTSYQYEQAIQNGMILFSTSSRGLVWIDDAVTTLVEPQADDDAGWKKIKRAKVRFELLLRVSDTIEPLIGQINNTPNGRANVVQNVNTLLQAMVREEKLLGDPAPAIMLDPANPPEGDSAWFVVNADDADSLDKTYFTFRFRYSPNNGAAA